VPSDHALCVKCGARVGDPVPTASPALAGREPVTWAAAAVAALLFAGLTVVAFRECRRRGEAPPRAPAPTMTASPARGPETPGRTGAADAGGPAATRRDAGLPARPDAGALILPVLPDAALPSAPPTTGGITTVRACVDARRGEAEQACGAYRPGSFTAESLCLIGKLTATYWTCLKHHAFSAGRCLTRCLNLGRACAQTCVADAGGSNAGCLVRCFRDAVDPCLGACLRP
jgi:hypothetical protein